MAGSAAAALEFGFDLAEVLELSQGRTRHLHSFGQVFDLGVESNGSALDLSDCFRLHLELIAPPPPPPPSAARSCAVFS